MLWLHPWQEARGIVHHITRSGDNDIITLKHVGSITVSHHLLASWNIPVLVGKTVSVLKTDLPGREYLFQVIGEHHE